MKRGLLPSISIEVGWYPHTGMQGFHVAAGSEFMLSCLKTKHLVEWIIPVTRRAIWWLHSHLMISLRSLVLSTEQMNNWLCGGWSPVVALYGKQEKFTVECVHECRQTKENQRLLSIFCHIEQPVESGSLAKKKKTWFLDLCEDEQCGFAVRKGQRSNYMLFWGKTKGQMRLVPSGLWKEVPWLDLMVSLKDSITLSIRNRFLSHCLWLHSLCLRRANQTYVSHSNLPWYSAWILWVPAHLPPIQLHHDRKQIMMLESHSLLFPMLSKVSWKSCENLPLIVQKAFLTQGADWQGTP